MKLVVGQMAPSFQVTDVYGGSVDLAAYAGRKTLLSFYRSASCPLCSLRVHYMVQRYPQLHKSGLQVISIFETSVLTTERYVGAQHPTFPIIADPQKKLYDLYGLEISMAGLIIGTIRNLPNYWRAKVNKVGGRTSDGDLRQMPADFLIGPDLTIRRAHYGRDTGDHLSFKMIEQFLYSA